MTAPATPSTAADALLEEMTRRGRKAGTLNGEGVPNPHNQEWGKAIGPGGHERGAGAVSVLDRESKNVSARKPRMNYSHEAMIDLMLAKPQITGQELADYFGYSQGWISTVKNSDAFKALYAQRRADLCDPELIATIRERLDTVAVASLRVLTEKLSQPAALVPDQLALKAMEVSTKALGFGANQSAVQVNITSESRISNLAHRLIALRQGSNPGVIDV